MITTSVGPLGVARCSMPAILLRTVSLSPATIGRAYSKFCSACKRCLPGESIRPSRRSEPARRRSAQRDGQVEVRDFLAVVEGARHLLDADDAAAGHAEALALHVLVGLDRVDGLVDLVHLEPDAESGQGGRFHQPDVTERAV